MNGHDEPTRLGTARSRTAWSTCFCLIRPVVCVAALIHATGCVTPQDRAYGIRPVEVTKIDGHVDLIFREQERELNSKTSRSTNRSKETILEESLTLDVDGFVFHPNVLELALGGVFGLVQERFEDEVNGRKRDTREGGDIREFNAQALLLKTRAYPMTFHAHRRRGLLPRPFLPSLETITTSYGLTWQYVSKTFPTTLRFNHTDITLSPLFITGQNEEDGRQRTTSLRFETAYRHSEHNILSVIYDHKSVKEQPFDFDYDADEVTLTHDLEWGDEHQHTLRSELNFLDQRGTIAIDRARWREDLRLRLSDSLQSRFRFEVLHRTRGNRSPNVPDVEERSYYLSGSLRHQLFLSQTTLLRLSVQRQEFEPGLEITRRGGQFHLNYRKNKPWGTLRADYRLRLERVKNRGAAQTAEVIDEPHTFQGADPITLVNRDTIVSSIAIRSQDRVTFFQLTRDYRTRTVGDIIEIERIATGRIADGETVLIEYRYNIGGTFTLDTVSQNIGVRGDFDFGLSPYYRFEWQNQTLSPATARSGTAEDITAHVLGLEFQEESFRMFAEYEDRDSTINPFKSTRLGSSYTHRFDSGAETSFHARWTDTTFDPPRPRELELLTLEGRHRHPITPDLLIEASVLHRDGTDTVSGDTDGIDLALSVEWFFRQLEYRLSFEQSAYEDENSENNASALFIHVRRGF